MFSATCKIRQKEQSSGLHRIARVGWLPGYFQRCSRKPVCGCLFLDRRTPMTTAIRAALMLNAAGQSFLPRSTSRYGPFRRLWGWLDGLLIACSVLLPRYCESYETQLPLTKWLPCCTWACWQLASSCFRHVLGLGPGLAAGSARPASVCSAAPMPNALRNDCGSLAVCRREGCEARRLSIQVRGGG